MNAREHWEKVYKDKDPKTDVSWYQARPTASLRLIEVTQLARDQPIIDVGGGASTLVDWLMGSGFHDLTVLDISRAALDHARRRLAERADAVTWLEADVTDFKPVRRFQLWHDRAVFHFLADSDSRRKYVGTLKRALAPLGWLIIATFAKDGPTRCSGLPVARHDADSIQAELGPEFKLIQQFHESHVTPWKMEQRFAWFLFQRESSSPVQENST